MCKCTTALASVLKVKKQKKEIVSQTRLQKWHQDVPLIITTYSYTIIKKDQNFTAWTFFKQHKSSSHKQTFKIDLVFHFIAATVVTYQPQL